MLPLVKRILQALIESGTIRQGVFPTSADAVAAAAVTLTADAAAWTWGVYTQIVAAAGVLVETQIEGFTLENFVGGPLQGEVIIASGAGAAEVELGRWPVNNALFHLPKPIRVPPLTRLACAFRSSTVVADTVDIKLLTTTGF